MISIISIIIDFEFDYVFITGLEEGLFPHFNSMNSNSEIEEERRFDDMMKMYGVDTHTQAPTKGVFIINTSCPLITSLSEKVKAKDENAKKIAKHIYTLANLSYRRLTGEEMKDFLADSYELLEML